MKLKYTLMAYSNRQKRLHTSSDESEANWPRFLVLERLEGTFEQTSLILLHRGITGMAGEPKLLKRIGKSAYLIETYKESHSSSLLKTNKIANIPVKITPHKSLNSSKGIIKNPELKYCTETEIHEELKQYGVTSVKKISIKRDNKTIPTGTHILTFDIPTLPSSVKIASLNIKVETYIPNPLRCFCCQKFGHHQSKCTRKSICPKCGEDGHPEEDCSSPVKCVNCEGAHPAFSRQCPKWQLEKKIQTIKFTNNISFQEARKIAQSQAINTQQPSYASAVISSLKPKSTSTIGTQTETTSSDPTPPNTSNSQIIGTPPVPLKSTSSFSKSQTKKTKVSLKKT